MTTATLSEWVDLHRYEPWFFEERGFIGREFRRILKLRNRYLEPDSMRRLYEREEVVFSNRVSSLGIIFQPLQLFLVNAASRLLHHITYLTQSHCSFISLIEPFKVLDPPNLQLTVAKFPAAPTATPLPRYTFVHSVRLHAKTAYMHEASPTYFPVLPPDHSSPQVNWKR